MHRSGTSLAAAMLCTAGVDAPRHLIAGDQYNEKGYWEPANLNRLDDELLDALDLAWHTPSTLPAGILRSAKAERFIPKYVEVLRKEYDDSALFCVKDPRLCRLLPILVQAFDSLEIEPSYVIQSRNPLEVAASLKHRDGFHASLSLMLWLRYLLEAEAHTRGKRRVFITYDALLNDWRSVLARVGERLEISWPRRSAVIDVEFERIISNRLKHQTTSPEQLANRKDIPDWIVKARTAILAACADRTDPGRAFDEIQRELENADKAFEPIFLTEQQQAREAGRVLSDIRKQFQASKAEAESARAHVIHLEEYVSALSERLEASETDLRSARETADERAISMEDLQRKLEALELQAASSVDRSRSVEGNLGLSDDALQLARARVTQDQFALASVETRPSLAAAELASISAHIKYLEQCVSNLRDNLDVSQAQLKAANVKAARHEVELASRQKELLELQMQGDEGDAGVRALERNQHCLRIELAESKRAADEREQKIANQEGQIVALNAAIAHLKRELAAKEGNRIECDREIAKRDSEVAALKARAADLEGELAERQQEVAENARRVMELGLKLSEDEQQRNEYSSRLALREAELEARIAELNVATTRIAEFESRVTSLGKRLTMRESACTELEKALLISEAEARAYRADAELTLTKQSQDATKSRVALSAAQVDVAIINAKLTQLNVQLELERETAIGRLDELGTVKGEVDRLRGALEYRNEQSEGLSIELVAARNALNAAQMELRNEREAFTRAQMLRPRHDLQAEAVEPAVLSTSQSRETDSTITDPPLRYDASMASEIPNVVLERYQRVLRAVERRGHERRSCFEDKDVLPLRIEDHGSFLSSLSFDVVEQPTIDILIPCFNEFEMTVESLGAIKAANVTVPYRVILSDDGSTDWRMKTFAGVPGLLFLTSTLNRNFLLNCNEAYAFVRAPYLLLLNNDAQVEAGCLERLVKAIEEERDAVAAGPMILYPNGRLQEAGCSIRSDASTIMVGVGENPVEPQYNYRREIQYASGACLMVKTASIGETLFDPQYVPAYCEDVDLCLRLRAGGGRIIYEPSARAIHHLSVSTGRIGQVRRVQQAVRNQERVFQKWGDQLASESSARVLAFYLPQFHPIAENDLWWGRGFTEWTNVTDAVPSFDGHYQPHLPFDLGYYDLRLTDVMGQQQALAEQYGIEGFVVYYYNFAGKRVLEAPMENLLRRPDVNFRFALCWANENWTKHWDGGAREVLLAQSYDQQSLVTVADDAVRFARDPRSIWVNGKPLFLIYRPLLIPDMARYAEYLRRRFSQAGFPGLHLVYVESMESFHDRVAPSDIGCDACVEFPPHGIAAPLTSPLRNAREGWNGYAYDYGGTVENALNREGVAYPRYPCVFPSWDNTPRQTLGATVLHGASPELFQAYVEGKLDHLDRYFVGQNRLLFVNAWNEWAEGAHLEPDRVYGHRWLAAVRGALVARGALGGLDVEKILV